MGKRKKRLRNRFKRIKRFMGKMSILEISDKLLEIIQVTYFRLNPLNPNNTEDNYQELLRENIYLGLGLRVSSEVSYQRDCLNILGEEVLLKNKTERLDLVIKGLDSILELKCVEKLEKVHENQLLSYLNNLDYKYGVLINFAKSKSMRFIVGHCKIYERGLEVLKRDKYGVEYKVKGLRLIKEMFTENYNDLFKDLVN